MKKLITTALATMIAIYGYSQTDCLPLTAGTGSPLTGGLYGTSVSLTGSLQTGSTSDNDGILYFGNSTVKYLHLNSGGFRFATAPLTLDASLYTYNSIYLNSNNTDLFWTATGNKVGIRGWDGNMRFYTGSGAYTEALTIDNSQNANFNGSVKTPALYIQNSFIGSDGSGEIDLNYNNSAVGGLYYWGGTTVPKFIVDRLGNTTLTNSLTGTTQPLKSTIYLL